MPENLVVHPQDILSLEDSIDPIFQCNHDDKMAIQADQSLLNVISNYTCTLHSQQYNFSITTMINAPLGLEF